MLCGSVFDYFDTCATIMSITNCWVRKYLLFLHKKIVTIRLALNDTDVTLPIELYETSFTSSVYCNEMTLYWMQTGIPKLMVMILEVIDKKLGIKLPKTNNTSEQGNKIYGNDVDEVQEPQDLLMKSLKEVVEREYSMHAAN